MALFFDQAWFSEKLEASGLSKPDLARALGLSDSDLAAMWKDQREISEREIKTMALMLNVSEAEVRKRGGVQGSPEARAAAKGLAVQAPSHAAAPSVEERLTALEEKLDRILSRLEEK